MQKTTAKLATLTIAAMLLAGCGNESQQSNEPLSDASAPADSGKPPADLVLRGGKMESFQI